jgi:hypothetical protein
MKIKRLRKIITAVLLSAFMLGTLGATAVPDNLEASISNGCEPSQDQMDRIMRGECPPCVLGEVCSRCVRVKPDDCEWLEAVGRLTRDEIDGIMNGEPFPADFPPVPPSYLALWQDSVHDLHYTVYDTDGEYVKSGVVEMIESSSNGASISTTPSLPVEIPPYFSVRFRPANDARGWSVAPGQWLGFAFSSAKTRTVVIPTIHHNTSASRGNLVSTDFANSPDTNEWAWGFNHAQVGFYCVTLYNNGSRTLVVDTFAARYEHSQADINSWVASWNN